jgi:serpin B
MEPSQQLYISDVEHKTFVKIDELGTEAAAASAVVVAIPMAAVGRWPPPFQMIVDHPFLFEIAEHQSGAILFVGTVTDPSHRD